MNKVAAVIVTYNPSKGFEGNIKAINKLVDETIVVDNGSNDEKINMLNDLKDRGVEIMKRRDELPACPVATTVQLIGSKWKLLIMRNLLARPWRFNELRKSLDGISQKVLTDSLRSMEADGIITRTVYPEVPPRVEYALSDIGESMRPIISAMEEWGSDYKANYEIE